MAVDVGSAVGYLDLDISGFLAGLKSAQSEADKTSKSITAKVGSNISGIGKNLTSVGTTLTKNVTVPILGIGAAGLKTATDFEKGMSEVKAISGATGKVVSGVTVPCGIEGIFGIDGIENVGTPASLSD